MESLDVVVVGARCTGSPLATMLARRGLNVCVLDRAHYRSETPSTHMIQSCGVDVLDELGFVPRRAGRHFPQIQSAPREPGRIRKSLRDGTVRQTGINPSGRRAS